MANRIKNKNKSNNHDGKKSNSKCCIMIKRKSIINRNVKITSYIHRNINRERTIKITSKRMYHDQ